MRLVCLTVFAAGIAVFSGSLHADAVNVGFDAGYTTFAMNGLNRSNAELFGWEDEGHAQDVDSGFVVGVDETSTRLTPLPWLALGLREEYLQGNLAEMYSFDGDNIVYTDQASLTNGLLGFKITPCRDAALSTSLGAWVGYGYAGLEQHVTYDPDDGAQHGFFSAGIPVGELEGTVTYKLGSHVGLSVTGGWRWADAPELKSHGTPLGDAVSYYNGYGDFPVNVDFSGAVAKGALDLYF